MLTYLDRINTAAYSQAWILILYVKASQDSAVTTVCTLEVRVVLGVIADGVVFVWVAILISAVPLELMLR